MSPQKQSSKHRPPPPDLPEEEIILASLRAFQPNPSERFYDRMSGAPWTTPVEPSRPSGRRWWRYPAFGVPLLLIIILILLAVLSPPSLRVTAQRIAEYFIRADSDRTYVEITPVGPGQLDYDFHQTIPEAETAAGFPVRAPQDLPPFLHFNGAEYVADLETVFLDYRSADSQLVLRITQKRVAGGETYARIGVTAEVEPVQIGSVAGEYVVGGWKLPELATPFESAAPGVKITLEAAWESEAQIQILRWLEGDMLFEILSVVAPTAQGAGLTKSDLIALAEGME